MTNFVRTFKEDLSAISIQLLRKISFLRKFVENLVLPWWTGQNLYIINLTSDQTITDESESYGPCDGQEASLVMPDGASLFPYFQLSRRLGKFQKARIRWRWRVSDWVNDEIYVHYYWLGWHSLDRYDSTNPPPTTLSYSPWYDLPLIKSWDSVDDNGLRFRVVKVSGPDNFTLYLDCAILEVTSFLGAASMIAILRRTVEYARHLTPIIFIRDVFKSVKIILIIRKFVENLSIIGDVFSSVLTPLIKPLKAIRARFIRTVVYYREMPQELVISERFRVVKGILRKIRENLSVIGAKLSSIYTPLIIPVYRFIQNLSVIGDIFTSVVVTPVEETVRRKFAKAQEELAELKRILKAKFSLRRRK